jgi:hypothetical protein
MDTERRVPTIQDIWKLFLAIIGVIAVIKELRKPAEERTWHGTVAEFVPYDFRMPTVERVRNTYWNPEGPILSSKVFGVGWAPNFGVLGRVFGEQKASEADSTPDTQ